MKKYIYLAVAIFCLISSVALADEYLMDEKFIANWEKREYREMLAHYEFRGEYAHIWGQSCNTDRMTEETTCAAAYGLTNRGTYEQEALLMINQLTVLKYTLPVVTVAGKRGCSSARVRVDDKKVIELVADYFESADACIISRHLLAESPKEYHNYLKGNIMKVEVTDRSGHTTFFEVKLADVYGYVSGYVR